jgi:hypothetical protein
MEEAMMRNEKRNDSDPFRGVVAACVHALLTTLFICAPVAAAETSPYVPALYATLDSFTAWYWVLFAVGLFWAASSMTARRRMTWAVIVMAIFGYGPVTRYLDLVPALRARMYYDDKCATVAGEKIYRKVQDVEGVVLLKIRPEPIGNELADLMWPGAAFALESGGNSYLSTFLGYEYSSSQTGEPVRPDYRGYIGTNTNPGGLPGYRFVDVIDEKDGKRYRVTGSNKAVSKQDTTAPNVRIAMANDPNYDTNVYSWVLDKVPAPDPSPRYGVTFEDHVIPEERAMGIASSTVKVIDLETKEVLGEMTRYALGGNVKPSANYPRPWLNAHKCPDHARGYECRNPQVR